MERYRLVSRSTCPARRRFVPLVVSFLLAALLTQANVITAGSPAPTPPSEKILAEYGQWETEYGPDTGVLYSNYVGDPNSTVQPGDNPSGRPDFVISSPALLTGISDVHVYPNTDATHAPTGWLQLVDAVGNDYGPFAAGTARTAAYGGKAGETVLWFVSVDHIELPPGHYWVHDSDPSSLLHNTQTHNVGATLVKGVDAAAYARYMDGLIAVNESEPELAGVTPTPVGNIGGKQPEKVTYSNPQPVVNSTPDPAVTSYPPNHPSEPCQFVTDKPMMVTKIMDYHINDGKGSPPKLIGLQEHVGTWYGSWPAYGQAYKGIPNAIWVVTPNYEIPAGSYTVQDNEFGTLSAGPDNRAMCVVKLAPVVTSPIDNVTGKYSIGLSGDDETGADFPLVLAVIDHKNSLEVGTIVADYPFKFDAAVTGREHGVVTARYSQGISDFSLIIRMTFTKKGDIYVLTGRIIVLGNGDSGGINFSGDRTSTDLPGFVPKPSAGIGKIGDIPGPGSEGQAAAGIAFPTLATLIAGSAAAMGGAGGGGGYAGDTGDSSGAGDGGTDSSGTDDGGADSGGTYNGGADSSGADDSGADDGGAAAAGADIGGADTAGAYTGGADIAGTSGIDGAAGVGDGSAGVVGAAAGGSPEAGPAVAPAPAPPAGPQDGQTMSVHDSGDGVDKTYVYHADTGEWINPLTGGPYVDWRQATSAQDSIETASEVKKNAEHDAYAQAEGMNKSAMEVVEDGRARVRLLAEIQKTQRAIYDTSGAEGDGPISSSDRLDSLAQKVANHEISVADAQALLNRQQHYDSDIHTGKAGTQAAADLKASQDTVVAAAAAAISNVETGAAQGAYDAVTDVQGKTWSGLAVRATAGYLTGGASEYFVYLPANIAVTMNANMDAGDSATRGFLKAFVSEGITQLLPIGAMHAGGALLKGAGGALGKTAAQSAENEVAKAAEDFAAHNAAYRAAQQEAGETVGKLEKAAAKGSLTIDDIKTAHSDTMTRRALTEKGSENVKTAYNEIVDTKINKPAFDHAEQSLTEKYTNISDPADPGYPVKKLMDDGYKVKVVEVRTPKIPKPGEPVIKTVNADGDVAGYLEKVDADGKVIHRVELPSHDVMAAQSEGLGKSMEVYDPATKTFNAPKASAELGIDFNDVKTLTKGMSKSDLAKFGVNEDLSNVTGKLADVDKVRQLQLNKYAKSYGVEVNGPARPDFARDFSNAKTVMKTADGIGVTPGEKAYNLMSKSGGQGGLIDPQGLAFMERNKVVAGWNAGTVKSQAEAMQSLGKMGKVANEVAEGYKNLGVKPLPANLQEAVNIAKNTSLSPAERALEFQRLNVGDPLTVVEKISAHIEGAKMALPKK